MCHHYKSAKDDLFINQCLELQLVTLHLEKDNKVKLPVETKINSEWIKYVIEKQMKKGIIEILLDVEIL